ncbi:MAG: hypothetical protein A3I76_01220 [Elusimicrobia bacterium RIFCSPLOWO2_02_FULL_61_11]|nr:MAG: hypothetical protein A3I76_01220 [Elusimicrobia bacterium RIFCSPLOWO2_02_FULL_61_11]
MKLISALVLTLSIAAPAMASDFADLQGLKASSIAKVNPFPNPGNPDSCYLVGMQEGLCQFKCRGGETFQVKPVKPQASSVYEKCGAADYRGASASAEQTFESYGKYATAQKASETLTWAVNGLKSAKAEVTKQTLVVKGLSDYGFRINFRAAAQLAIEPGPTFSNELDAYERMFEMADRLEGRGATVAIHEVVAYGPGQYYYVLGFFNGDRAGSSQADKKIKACVLNSYADNVCNYKCNDGSVHTQPLATPGPWNNNPVVLCPQLVFPF